MTKYRCASSLGLSLRPTKAHCDRASFKFYNYLVYKMDNNDLAHNVLMETEVEIQTRYSVMLLSFKILGFTSHLPS